MKSPNWLMSMRWCCTNLQLNLLFVGFNKFWCLNQPYQRNSGLIVVSYDIEHTWLEKARHQMACNKGIAIVVMGVSGAGKSTIGTMLAQVMNARFVDADDYHPQSNKDKMKAGIPLSDEDRIPWLQTLRDTLRRSLADGETTILACSALHNHYRDILRSADPHYTPLPSSASCAVRFVFLSVPADVLAARLEKRGNHFMSPKLLQSQLDLLQIDESEGILQVDASLHPHQTLEAIRASLMPIFPSSLVS